MTPFVIVINIFVIQKTPLYVLLTVGCLQVPVQIAASFISPPSLQAARAAVAPQIVEPQDALLGPVVVIEFHQTLLAVLHWQDFVDLDREAQRAPAQAREVDVDLIPLFLKHFDIFRPLFRPFFRAALNLLASLPPSTSSYKEDLWALKPDGRDSSMTAMLEIWSGPW